MVGMGHWLRALSTLLDVLSPPACAACDAPGRFAPFCSACGEPLVAEVADSIAGVPLVVVGSYAAPLADAITRLKYGNRPELSLPLARLLAPRLQAASVPADAVLTPVPLHPRRLATRGYNQAGLLARDLATLSGRRHSARLLARIRDTPRQVGQARLERVANVESAFRVRSARPERVVLVDDVVTTGSTVRACAQALRVEGFELTAVVALARAEHC
jgi:ComF family protein